MINHPDVTFDPPIYLALRHCPPPQRAQLALLLALDSRLGVIIRQSSEPLIVQMRFAWWRDMLAKTHEHRPKGEPLLAALSAIEINDMGATKEAMAHLVDCWEMLIDQEAWHHDVISPFHTQRAQSIFGTFAETAAPDYPAQSVLEMGILWSSHQLANMLSAPNADIGIPKPQHRGLPRQLRPLAILQRAATLEFNRKDQSLWRYRLATLGLLWFSMTGH